MESREILPDPTIYPEQPERVWAEGHEQREIAEGNGELIQRLWQWFEAEVTYSVNADRHRTEEAGSHYLADEAAEQFRLAFMAQVARRAAEREEKA